MHDAVRRIIDQMERNGYITDPEIATAVYLAMELKKPLLIEGQAGVGKTEIAKVLANMLGVDLIRLQCYEGLDVNTSLYEWNYPKQMLRIKMEEHDRRSVAEKEQEIFGEEFLLKRPLLDSITRADRSPVLLIDEVDRADDEFEAFLLEVLSEFAVTIPEIGRIGASAPPAVILTSNRTRDLHDALKRRCLYHWIDHPTLEREVEIVRVRAPGVPEALAVQVARAVGKLRELDVAKRPGVAETIDWAHALAFLGVDRLDGAAVEATLGAVLKDHDDIAVARTHLPAIVSAAAGS